MDKRRGWYRETSLGLQVVFLFTVPRRCFFCGSYLCVFVFVILPCLFSAAPVRVDYLVNLYVMLSCSVTFPYEVLESL